MGGCSCNVRVWKINKNLFLKTKNWLTFFFFGKKNLIETIDRCTLRLAILSEKMLKKNKKKGLRSKKNFENID